MRQSQQSQLAGKRDVPFAAIHFDPGEGSRPHARAILIVFWMNSDGGLLAVQASPACLTPSQFESAVEHLKRQLDDAVKEARRLFIAGRKRGFKRHTLYCMCEDPRKRPRVQ